MLTREDDGKIKEEARGQFEDLKISCQNPPFTARGAEGRYANDIEMNEILGHEVHSETELVGK